MDVAGGSVAASVSAGAGMHGVGGDDPRAADEVRDVEVAIVGAGFSGLAMAVYLDRAGIHDFVLLEKAADVGGTWRENTYPGAACDVPSHLYSFSFEHRPDWTHVFSRQPEILDYLRHCARKYDVYRRTRFGSRVEGASWDEVTGRWTVRLAGGAPVRARTLVLGNGGLHLPQYPDIPGRERFDGASFHSARWDHAFALDGKRVAVIGTGASAIQFVPQIAPRVERLHLFQRTPPWILPRPDRAYRPSEKARFARSPLRANLHRARIYAELEARAYAFVVDPRILKFGERFARRFLARSVPDAALRRKLTPHYTMGCKRILMSNDYYPALCRSNVELVTEPIEALVAGGVRTRDGRLRDVDAVIYGTGFDVAGYLLPLDIAARGVRLADEFARTRASYLGISVSGFPNLFLLMGPNTGLGHNSMVFMIEAQARYATQAICVLREKHGTRSLDVRPEAQAAFHAAVRRRLKRTVWQTGGCASWYKTADGENSTLWPGFTAEYWLRTRRLRLRDYTLS